MLCVVVMVPMVPPRKRVDRLREREVDFRRRLRVVISIEWVGGGGSAAPFTDTAGRSTGA